MAWAVRRDGPPVRPYSGGVTRYLLALALFLTGAMVAAQPPINAALARRSGSLWAAAISFAVGTVAIVAVSLLVSGGLPAAVRSAPAWQFVGGLLGALFVTSTILLVPRLGALGLVAAGVAGQLTGAVLIDRYGLFGLPRIPLSPVRVLGIGFLIIGLTLVLRR